MTTEPAMTSDTLSTKEMDGLERVLVMCEQGKGHNPGMISLNVETFRRLLDAGRASSLPAVGVPPYWPPEPRLRAWMEAATSALAAAPPHARGGTPCGEGIAKIIEENLMIENIYDGQSVELTITGIKEAAEAIAAALSAPPAPGGLSACSAERDATQEGRPDGGEPSAEGILTPANRRAMGLDPYDPRDFGDDGEWIHDSDMESR